MYSAYNFNKQVDNILSWRTPFPIWNQSVVSCPIVTVASWPAYRFLRRQVRWSGIPISFRIFQFVVIHTVKGFGIVNKAEVVVFLELSCFFDDPTDAGNLISGSFAFSKTSLNIWKFTVSRIAEPGLENFEHYFPSVWDECNCAVVWTFLWTFLVAQMVKRLSTMRETRVWSLGQEDPLEKEMAIHSSTIAWKIPWSEEPGRLQSMGSQRVRHDWATSLSLSQNSTKNCISDNLDPPLLTFSRICFIIFL